MFDPLGNAVHAAPHLFDRRRGLLVTGGGPGGADGAGGRAPDGRETDGRDRRQRLSAGAGERSWAPISRSIRDARTWRPRAGTWASPKDSASAGRCRAKRGVEEVVRNMAHGGRIVALGLPGGAGIHVDWAAVVFKMLTIQGVMRPADLRHLACDGGPRRRRSGPVADHHPSLCLRGSRSGFRNRRLGPVRESHPGLVRATPREGDRWKRTSCEQRVLTTEWRS